APQLHSSTAPQLHSSTAPQLHHDYDVLTTAVKQHARLYSCLGRVFFHALKQNSTLNTIFGGEC
ncbi:MAG: hypothetical protein QM632_04415, partial [Micrococcaceae bacterium]